MTKQKAIASVELIVDTKANRGAIIDEVTTILRGNKIKDITISMSKVSSDNH